MSRGRGAGTSTEAIARRSGVSQPYLFQLFGTKKDLFIAAVRHGFRRRAGVAHVGTAALEQSCQQAARIRIVFHDEHAHAGQPRQIPGRGGGEAPPFPRSGLVQSGEGNGERAPAAIPGAGDLDGAAVHLQQVPGDGQTQTEAAVRPRADPAP